MVDCPWRGLTHFRTHVVSGRSYYLSSKMRAGRRPLRFVFKILSVLLTGSSNLNLYITYTILRPSCPEWDWVLNRLPQMYVSWGRFASYVLELPGAGLLLEGPVWFFWEPTCNSYTSDSRSSTLRYIKRFCTQNPPSNSTTHNSILCPKGYTVAVEGCKLSNNPNPLSNY